MGGVRGCGGVHGCRGHAWFPGGIRGCCWACMVVGGGACLVAEQHGCRGGLVWLGGAWLFGVCVWLWGACMVAGGMCGFKGHVWLPGGAWLQGGMCGCWRGYMVVGGMCGCWVGGVHCCGGHAWLLVGACVAAGGMHGC